MNSAGRRVVLSIGTALLWSVFGCVVGGGEKYTAGTLDVMLSIGDSGAPAAGVTSRLFELDHATLTTSELDDGSPYLSDPQGAFRHVWGWLGGGASLPVRLVVDDSLYVAVDTTAIFPVRGTKDDNRLTWSLTLTRRGG